MLEHSLSESDVKRVDDLKLFFSNSSLSTRNIEDDFGSKGSQIISDFARSLSREERSYIALLLEEIKWAMEEMANGREDSRRIETLLDSLGNTARPVYRALKSIESIKQITV